MDIRCRDNLVVLPTYCNVCGDDVDDTLTYDTDRGTICYLCNSELYF